MSKKRVIIPARMHSARLPGKILLNIAGKPMIQWVHEKAIRCNLDSVLIATDDKKIYDVATKFGAEVILTSKDHTSGTDRLAEAVKKMDYADDDLIVNIQGDEPIIPEKVVFQVLDNLEKYPQASVSTLCEAIHTLPEVLDPNSVKVVFDKNGLALYFSRAPIPWDRDNFPSVLSKQIQCFRHIGMYAYRAKFLKHYANITPSKIEEWERLEQLRILWHGEKIHVDIAAEKTLPGVDTEEDLKRVRDYISKQK
ncbi:MAG: 3-deoxy-manno-octulosonate cytidylyltransferase (CMP-KDO synthetase) [Francisellaceae bacterium]|jgi:3-deoxy-manno-octulosonate cytidylyltransferase (CMP-KDO synthetase)